MDNNELIVNVLKMEQDAALSTLRQRVAELERERDGLKIKLDVSESVAHMLAHPMKSPFCEHSSQYSYTEDGGKNIRCLLCAEAALKEIRAVRKEQSK